MKSYDYDAVAYDGAVYCVDCLPDGLTINSEGIYPVFAGSEWDYYPTCDHCGIQHDYVGLTAAGQKYESVKEATMLDREGQFDGLKVSDLSEVPEEYEGEILHVNDHGNVTLYVQDDCGDLTEIGSIV